MVFKFTIFNKPNLNSASYNWNHKSNKKQK